MAQVVRANDRLGRRMVMGAGMARQPRGGAAGGRVGGGGETGGSASGRSSPMGAFGDENERESGGFIGPFGWGGDLTPDAKAARATHQQLNENEANAIGKIQDEMGKGADFQTAFRNVIKSQPDALHTLVLGGHLKDLAGFQQLVSGGNDKGFNLSPGAAHFNSQGQKIAENPIQPGSIKIIGQDANGDPIYESQGSRGQAPGIHFTPQNNTPVGANKAQSQADKNEAGANKENAQTADPYAGKPYKINEQDSKFVSAAPQVLQAAQALKMFGEVTGPLSGPAQTFLAKMFGTNDMAIAYSAARSNLERALMEGNIPSAYRGSMEKFLGTLPKTWQNTRFNTADLNQFASSFRSEANARVANIEHENGGRALPDTVRDQLKDQGVIAPSYGWDNPIALLGAGPDAVKNMSQQQLQWLSQHKNVLTPAQAAIAGPEIMRRASLEQGQTNQATPAAQGQQAPQAPAAPAGGPNPAAAPTPAGPQASNSGNSPLASGPTNADQQSQLPQQIQQAQSQMAPPGAQTPPPGGVNPATLQPDQAELQRQKQAQELIDQARASAQGM